MTAESYSIKDLENFTKIKAHTIRIWEQRYNLLSPKRTDTNIRFYDKDDLKKILNVNLLYTNGLKISKIAALSDQEIIDKCKEILNQEKNNSSKEIENYIIELTEFNATGIRDLLAKSSQLHGLEMIYSKVLNPLLVRMGELWQVNTLDIVHEHFLSGLVQEFVINQTVNNRPQKSNGKKAVFFLHEDELHELSLLYYNLIFTLHGYDCYYLGPNLPMKELEVFSRKVDPDIFVTSFIRPLSEKEFKGNILALKQFTQNKQLAVSGFQAVKYKSSLTDSIRLIESDEDLKKIIDQRK